MDSELIRRYVYAVTKRLPRKSREDVAKELNTLIADMLEERCGQVLPTEKDVRVVLTELGTPAELYDQYSGEGKLTSFSFFSRSFSSCNATPRFIFFSFAPLSTAPISLPPCPASMTTVNC